MCQRYSDEFSWLCSGSGNYSYAMLCQGSERFPLSDCIWKSKAPMKCIKIVWHAAQHRIWTSDWRERDGLQDQSHPILSVFRMRILQSTSWFSALMLESCGTTVYSRLGVSPYNPTWMISWRLGGCEPEHAFTAKKEGASMPLWLSQFGHYGSNGIHIYSTTLECNVRLWSWPIGFYMRWNTGTLQVL